MWNTPMVQSRQPLTYRLMESMGLGGPRWHGNSRQRGIAESGSSQPSTLMIDIPGDLVRDLPCMQQASYLEGGPLVWILPLYLHVNQKTDYDDMIMIYEKPTDLDLHCLQRQDISGFSRTRINQEHANADARLTILDLCVLAYRWAKQLTGTLDWSYRAGQYRIRLYLQEKKWVQGHILWQMSCNVRKCTFWYVCPTKTQISLHIYTVWSVFAVHRKELCTLGYLKYAQWRFWSDCVNVRII